MTDLAPTPLRRCPSTAYLRVAGVDVATLRCTDNAGHGGQHFTSFGWDDDDAFDGIDWPEAHDPDEGFDVEVDAEPPAAEPDDLDDVLARLDAILDDHRVNINASARYAAALDEAVPLSDDPATAELQRRYGDGPAPRCGAAFPTEPGVPCILPRGHRGAHDLGALP